MFGMSLKFSRYGYSLNNTKSELHSHTRRYSRIARQLKYPKDFLNTTYSLKKTGMFVCLYKQTAMFPLAISDDGKNRYGVQGRNIRVRSSTLLSSIVHFDRASAKENIRTLISKNDPHINK